MTLLEQVSKFLVQNGPLQLLDKQGVKVEVKRVDGEVVFYRLVKKGRPSIKQTTDLTQFVWPDEVTKIQ